MEGRENRGRRKHLGQTPAPLDQVGIEFGKNHRLVLACTLFHTLFLREIGDGAALEVDLVPEQGGGVTDPRSGAGTHEDHPLPVLFRRSQQLAKVL